MHTVLSNTNKFYIMSNLILINFAHSPLNTNNFLNKSIWLVDGTLIDRTTPDSRWTCELIAINWYFMLPRSPEQEPHRQMQFSPILKMLPPFWRVSYSSTKDTVRLLYTQPAGQLDVASIQQSSSSCRAASTDIPDPLSPLLPIVHRFWQVFRATSRILTELLYVCSSCPSCFCSAIWGCP